LKFLKYFSLKFRNDIRLIKFQVLWRSINVDNFTSVGRIFPLKCVSVGFRSYGELNVYSYSNGKDESLRIGSYVSIANNVSFILGGNHNINTITTYPLKTFILNVSYQDAFSRGPIIIENEVWIGFGATILSGVTVGKGAIIAANSVVVKDIPAYSVAAGNPAKVIKYRFESDIIQKLEKIELTDFSDVFIKDKIDDYYRTINNKEDILNIIKKNML